jgi:hypothetical protein
MKKHDGLLTFAGFLGLSIIIAHIVNWSVGEPYAFYTYPAMWLLALAILATVSLRHNTRTAHVQQETAGHNPRA